MTFERCDAMRCVVIANDCKSRDDGDVDDVTAVLVSVNVVVVVLFALSSTCHCTCLTECVIIKRHYVCTFE